MKFHKILVCKVLNVIKWKNRHLGGFFVGFVGVVGLYGGWVGHCWIVGILSFQKIYGLYGLKHHTVDLLSCTVDPDF